MVMAGIGNRAVKLAKPVQRTINATVVGLHELAASMFRHASSEKTSQAALAREMADVIEVGLAVAGPQAIGSTAGFHLQRPISTRICSTSRPSRADQPRADHARLVGPLAENEVDIVVLSHATTIILGTVGGWYGLESQEHTPGIEICRRLRLRIRARLRSVRACCRLCRRRRSAELRVGRVGRRARGAPQPRQSGGAVFPGNRPYSGRRRETAGW